MRARLLPLLLAWALAVPARAQASQPQVDAPARNAAGDAAPSLELLEFLGTFATDDPAWQDPMELPETPAAPDAAAAPQTAPTSPTTPREKPDATP